MRVSHPIDQLIHDLEHERAKDYWGRVKRFKAQEAERRKAGKAHEKKQLEYMRAVGIKPGTIEKEQEENSRELKSYLKQTRPHWSHVVPGARRTLSTLHVGLQSWVVSAVSSLPLRVSFYHRTRVKCCPPTPRK